MFEVGVSSPLLLLVKQFLAVKRENKNIANHPAVKKYNFTYQCNGLISSDKAQSLFVVITAQH